MPRIARPSSKPLQEVITLVVFAAISVLVLGEAIKWNRLAGFARIAPGAFFVFHKW